MAAGDIIVSRANEAETAPEFPCGLCGVPPPDCCLYPWPFDDEGTPLYPPEDLPDTIFYTFGSATLYRYTSSVYSTDYAFSATGDDSGSVDDSNSVVYATPYNGNWVGNTGLPTGCLIAEVLNLTDQFPDTLTADFSPPVTFYRDPDNTGNLCCYGDRAFEDGSSMMICYQIFSVDFPGLLGETKPTWIFSFPTSGSLTYPKDDPQNGPTGTYGGGSITIS